MLTSITGTHIIMNKTYLIQIWGIVQGVGFRPFVAKLADRMQLRGEVRNLGGLVEILFTDTPKRKEEFLQRLYAEKPLPAELVHVHVSEIEERAFSTFEIKDSGEGDDEAAMIPADLAICSDCLRELKDKSNPRYRHPFISCMVCGPRYTIIDRIPYDRENTSMTDFAMCEFCHREYTDRNDRRYHAQTVSCHACGPTLIGQGQTGQHWEKEEALANAISLLNSEQVIAVKGTGGYYLACSPKSEVAVAKLRQLKQREEKPFAVLFSDKEQLERFCKVTEEEENLLQSAARPIVLLEKKENGEALCFDVCRTSRYIGAFYPSMGLQHLLLEACGPLIMTSANQSDQPIIVSEDEMFAFSAKSPQLAAVFYNIRSIRQRVDDSVVRLIDGKPQMIRRSKGYAPVPLHINRTLSKTETVFAAGGQLKSAFALTKGNFAYVSPFLGDLDSVAIQAQYKEAYQHMKTLFRIEPKLVVSDLHPLYHTTVFSKTICEKTGLPHLFVQHHHAHIASVIAEHDLRGPVLGVSFDGTGYGTDGTIWGGEFLRCEGGDFQRVAQLESIEMIGGDGSMKEGWKSAMCYARHCGTTKRFEGNAQWTLVKAGLDHKINSIRSSSMGRLFDAVSAYTGIQADNRYEGECAIQLENRAAEAISRYLAPYPLSFSLRDGGQGTEVLAAPLFLALEEAVEQGIDVRRIALGFHLAVADMIVAVCNRGDTRQIALSGGVFQNKILMEDVASRLRNEGYSVFYNCSVSPNDGGLCLGQAYLGMEHLMRNR